MMTTRLSMNCGDCGAYPTSENEADDYRTCCDALRCEGCASVHECAPHEQKGQP